MHAGFGFEEAAAIAGYLAELGVSHLYLSPILQAARGSTHGYDVVDPTRVNVELGGEAGFARLGAALDDAGLGQLLDVVPNHMAITGPDNRWWWDVLRNGRASRYAPYFDVDWDSREAGLRDTVLLPILGDHYGRELEAGRFTLQREGADIVVRYFDHRAPLDPGSLTGVLATAAERLQPGAEGAELGRLVAALERLPDSATTDPVAVAERQRSVDGLQSRLREVVEGSEAVGAAVDEVLSELGGDVEALDELLGRQHFRLAWWRSAGDNLDYRRFFDINDLAGIRVEDPQVFADSHWLVLDWLSRGVVDGVRIDHVDGLLDPGRYLGRLSAAAPSAWVVVEKILERGEELPPSWPVAGTTGYDWTSRLNQLVTRREGWLRLVERYRGFTLSEERWEDVVRQAKRATLDGSLAADLTRLVNRFAAVCARHRRHRDHTRRDLHDALAEVAASFPVYRTYVAPGPDGRLVASASDEATVERAVRTAGMLRPELDPDLLGLVRDVLLGRLAGEPEQEVALRFQQLTGPVMAKSVEDTGFYRWLPLSSLNEVGGDPGEVDDRLDAFHDAAEEAAASWPHALLATSTHDTKRSEDVRARLCVLAELPDEWADAVEAWWTELEGASWGLPPDRNTAWLITQSLVGAWPMDADRAVAYVEKATREAKLHTSWTDPDPVYDDAVAAFVRGLLSDPASLSFLDGWAQRLAGPGRSVALAQKLLTLTAPGIPDLYQGSELWDLSLVDPDNRRPVDYARRRALLADASPGAAVAAWAAGDPEGMVKLHVVRATLALRGEHPDWYAGGYERRSAVGPGADHAVAFSRGDATTVATRWPVTLQRAGGWGDTELRLPGARFTDRLSGREWDGPLLLAEVLDELPVALLVRHG